jgi:HTH domain
MLDNRSYGGAAASRRSATSLRDPRNRTVVTLPMSRSDRMFEIIQLLRSADQPLTADAIAGTLEVTKRTVYRDISALAAMRVPIEGEAGVGYIMRPGFDLPPLMFTAEEVEAIVVGLALLGRTGDDGLLSAATTSVRRSLRCYRLTCAADSITQRSAHPTGTIFRLRTLISIPCARRSATKRSWPSPI